MGSILGSAEGFQSGIMTQTQANPVHSRVGLQSGESFLGRGRFDKALLEPVYGDIGEGDAGWALAVPLENHR
jgi:hypothetical protein